MSNIKKLTKRQKEALAILDKGEDIVYSYGEAYVGDERTNMKLIQSLLRHGLISVSDYSNFDQVERYIINGTGKEALKSGFVKDIWNQ